MAYKSKGASEISREVHIEEKYLGVDLIPKEKELLALSLKVKNDRGDYVKWRTIKKLIVKSGYRIKERVKTVNGVRRNVSKIVSDSDCESSHLKQEELKNSKCEITVPERYLCKYLTPKEKDLLAQHLNINNRRGGYFKWRTIKRLIMESGYELSDKVRVVNGVRRNVSKITRSKQDIQSSLDNLKEAL